jgi:hypothetical protein
MMFVTRFWRPTRNGEWIFFGKFPETSSYLSHPLVNIFKVKEELETIAKPGVPSTAKNY